MSFKTIEELDLSDEFIRKCSNDSEVQAVCNFFQRIENDKDPTDLSVAEESYYKSFLFCDPDNANSVKREDFLNFLPAMTVKYKESGFQEKKVKGIKIVRLDKKYILAIVCWKMKFRKEEQEPEFHEIKATYILKNNEDGYKIILQLDHQILNDLL